VYKRQVRAGAVVAVVEAPADGYRAYFAEVDYDLGGLPYHLSTQLRVVGAKGK
jgi:hypothetical protein